ncbi:MAG TPA: MFS transporter, partial [Bacillota bacterium]|nr:MFS transporter [Bacillota bacterium]
MKKKLAASSAMAFIVLMGIVSMFSDITHEGAAGIMGAYLGLAGASAAAIGFVSGLGECIGYSLRLLTGYLTDRSKKYWTLTIIGYVIDCAAIPALALVPRGGWMLACGLIVVQRIGKAIKKPAKDTIISFAAAQNGIGKSFALQELLDQTGAFLGPVLLFLVMLLKKSDDMFSVYSVCFLILGIPALITIALLLFAKKKFPRPENFEQTDDKEEAVPFRLSKPFILYIVAISLFAAGFIDFSLITLHTANLALVPESTLSLVYAGAMAVDAGAALLFGWLFDKYGTRVLVLSTLLSAPFGLFVFLINSRWALLVGV